MPSVGLIELPAFALRDSQGTNWTAFRQDEPQGSKLILAGTLQADFDVTIVNLNHGTEMIDLGPVTWNDTTFRKIAVGRDWTRLSACDFDVWGITINFLQSREIACKVISHLAKSGGRVIVGGSDAFAEPHVYLNAGATLIVLDKSGGSNVAAVELALGLTPSTPYVVQTKDGVLRSGRPRMHPQEWPLPNISFAQQTLGNKSWEFTFPEQIMPLSTLMLDQGCDRKCDFCGTPNYKLGYQAMSPKRTRQWIDLVKAAGAKSILCGSDQFMGRILFENGRRQIIETADEFRESGMPLFWGNGLELKKATIGRGLPNGDPTPDRELIASLWGWNGSVGCVQSYIPAERPVEGSVAYPKLLEWQQHLAMMEAIVEAGVPDIYYGVIVGLAEDSDDTLARLLEAIVHVKERLLRVNPRLGFHAQPFSVRPIPGTGLTRQLEASGLLRFTDPVILGGWWTPCADTRYISYAQVANWQHKILREGSAGEGAWPGRLDPP